MKTNTAKFLTGLIMVIICMSITAEITAQSTSTVQKMSKKEMIQTQKVAYIAREINLSPAEAEKFWPLYNEFQAKNAVLGKPKRLVEHTLKQLSPEQITDQQAEELLNAQMAFEQNHLDLKKQYIEKYKAVIGVKRTALLFNAEKKFNNLLLKQLNERKPENK